jgi:hypothetical protein
MRGGGTCRRVCLVLAICWLSVSLADAQIGSGALAGSVADQAGAAVPGATVTISGVATNHSRTAVTGDDGGYVFTGLAPGEYRVRVEREGFRLLVREGVRMVTGETIRLDLRLQIGGVTEAVSVKADASLLRSESSGLGHVIDNRRVVDLPLNGRSFISLASLAPGVAVPPPAHVLTEPAQRTAHRRYEAIGRARGQPAGRHAVERSRAARHSLDRAIPGHTSDVSDRRLPAARVTTEYGE